MWETHTKSSLEPTLNDGSAIGRRRARGSGEVPWQQSRSWLLAVRLSVGESDWQLCGI
jgi:hypothetical protein